MSPEGPTDEEVRRACTGAAAWITPPLVRDRLRTFQRYHKETLTADDAVDMLNNMGHLLRLLSEKPKIKAAGHDP